ncbi:MAG: hypothetical protein KJ077_10900 [Anaerolineae bacterium]|nr:hypothetical protein [Anaerolineae bacterium]
MPKGQAKRQKRSKQPKPYWKWLPDNKDDESGRGRWVHPAVFKLLQAAVFGAAFGVAPGLLKAGLHLLFGDDIWGGVKEWFGEVRSFFHL